ncbi:Fe-only nitrogenase accessory protein AnfO [Geobacter sp. SVR]|uniref:Fe-only nitrogenase accessory protein AnfO n=1 Tax=Geobacter sp. SVR TaxID=2495594 RepID=UPI00143F01F5|nr:Fe-only nitrogenase accessory protein AnfO [Geobacter sp. SVR]BCS55072.1 Fe-only nitrogenase accessory protein AnfO [Geobacter sp. SVR]GCF85254.1 Fe-only nitrogenase accessory protein AnfO [Geobacter sp. SVR]
MKIASYVNTHGSVAGFHEKGRICLYEEDPEGGWLKTKEVPLDMNPDLSLSEIKAGIRHAVAHLDDCKVFVVRELRGLLHAVLKEEHGFRTWKSAGSLLEQLDSVARHDRDFVAAQTARAAAGSTCGTPVRHAGCGGGCSPHRSGSTPHQADGGKPESGRPLPMPQPLGNGYYRIDLAEILNNDASLNSKEVLVPFMAGVAFKQLEILCDHPPRWFARELYKLNLAVASEVPDSTGKGFKVLVVPNKDEAVQPD